MRMVLQRDETFMAVTSKARRFLSQLHKQFGKYSVPCSVLNDVSRPEYASSYGSAPSRRSCSSAHLGTSASQSFGSTLTKTRCSVSVDGRQAVVVDHSGMLQHWNRSAMED